MRMEAHTDSVLVAISQARDVPLELAQEEGHSPDMDSIDFFV